MNALLGIDGGGTKTRFVLTDCEGKMLNHTIKGPSSIDTVSKEETLKVLKSGISEVLSNVEDCTIISAFAGLGGIFCKEHEQEVIELMKSIDELKQAHLDAKSDIYSAYKAGLKNDYGIAIIIGTGIVAFTVNKKTNEHIRVGGYTYKEGDFGSSYDVGKRALLLISKYYDGRIEYSPLIDSLIKKYNIHSFNDVKSLYEKLYEERTEVAQLAKEVTKYANLNDRHAIKILEDATDEAVAHIEAILKRTNLENLEISITGSLGNVDTLYKELFYKKIKQINNDFNIHENLLDPSTGSIIIAMDNIGINPKSYMKNLINLKV